MKNQTAATTQNDTTNEKMQPYNRVTRLHPLAFYTLLALLTLFILAAEAYSALGQDVSQTSTLNPQPAIDPGVFTPLLNGVLGKYGWLTTVLLVIGSLRILFKPLMLVVENALKNDPQKFAAVQKFEAGPVYKVIATVLDVGASIKLPLVKPPGPPVS